MPIKELLALAAFCAPAVFLVLAKVVPLVYRMLCWFVLDPVAIIWNRYSPAPLRGFHYTAWNVGGYAPKKDGDHGF